MPKTALKTLILSIVMAILVCLRIFVKCENLCVTINIFFLYPTMHYSVMSYWTLKLN